MNIQLKNISHNARLSEETEAFDAFLYIDGKKVANVRNDGRGGSNMYHWYDQDARKAFAEYAKAHGDPKYANLGVDFAEDEIVNDLLEKYLMLKTYKRWVKKHTQTAFRLKTQKPGVFTIQRTPYTPAVKAQLEKEYGDNLDMIVNEFVKENE